METPAQSPLLLAVFQDGFKTGVWMSATVETCPHEECRLRGAWMAGFSEGRRTLPPVPAPVT